MKVLQLAGDGAGPCSRLMQLMGSPTTVNLKPSTPPAPRRPRPKRGPMVRPSRAAHYPATKMIDGVGVHHEDIAPKYDAGKIKREWDASRTSPAWALAADLTLIVMQRERKWTWQIADRYYKRLPWGHPAKTTPTGRPGWKRITGMLSKQGLIERKSGHTWRLTDAGRDVAGFLVEAWRSTGPAA